MADHSCGGGKKRDGLESGWDNNIIMQLKNVLDLNEATVKFNDQSERWVQYLDAQEALKQYSELKTTIEKSKFADNLAASPDSFLDSLDRKVKKQK